MKTLPLLMLALSVSATGTLSAAPKLEGSPEELRAFLHPQKHMVTLSDMAEKSAWTDKATINIVVSTEKSKLADAMAENAQVRQRIRAKAISLGVPEERIKNARFSSTPQYGWFGEKPSSFKVVNRVAVEIDNEQQMQGLAQLADAEKTMEFGNVEFEHRDKERFQREVKQEALDKITKQKTFYEKSLGVKLVPVSFHDGMVQPFATAGAAGLERHLRSAAPQAKMAESAVMYAADSAAPEAPSSFDEVRYQAHISVVYEVLAQP